MTDVPTTWIPPIKTNLTVPIDPEAHLASKYEAALRALISDMRKSGSASRKVVLEDGVRQQIDGMEIGYRFSYEGDADLFEGARITVLVEAKKEEGKIVAFWGTSLIISVDNDMGPHISICIVQIDNTAMLEALRERLAKIHGEETGFNTRLANAVITNEGKNNSPDSCPEVIAEELNEKQKHAIGHVLSNEITYLWGPPGTGKTQTISALCLALHKDNKRILLCSNTNQAVDQVLLKLCKRFTNSHPALAEGNVLRVGTIVNDELNRDWSAYITLEGILKRKSHYLLVRKAEFEEVLRRLNSDAALKEEVHNRFKALEAMQKQYDRLRGQVLRGQSLLQAHEDEVRHTKARIKGLTEERQKVLAANFIMRALMRPTKSIEADLNCCEKQLDTLAAKGTELNDKLQVCLRKSSLKEAPLQDLGQSVVAYDLKLIEQELAEYERQRSPVLEELSTISRQLEDMRKTVLEQAEIVGATVTKSYLSHQVFSNFDVVIIDEASMVILPALFHAAGLAKSKVVIAGDPRQLSPILQTDQKAILDLIGADIFHAAGIIDTMDKNSEKRTCMLEEQYRMDETICTLISKPMYRGQLRTSLTRTSCRTLPAPFSEKVIVVDTSTIAPFENRDPFKSRYNMMNALAIRNFCLYLNKKGIIPDPSFCGVCTPYAAQAKLTKRILKASGLSDIVVSGTVHRYQGDEKDVMLIDIPDSYGGQYAGIFLQGKAPEDKGSLLFNVAVSRAKEHVIFFANLAYLDRKLPGDAFLRDILFRAQESGKVYDVRKIISLFPIREELRTYGLPLNLSADAAHTGLYNEHDFDQVFRADLERAKKGIAIFSGFITPQRVATYESAFRRKSSQGVTIRCVTRPPSRNGSIPVEQGQEAIVGLEAMGCAVDLWGTIHQKLAIIDDEVLWFGSLNPLSFGGQTSEVMARIVDKYVALQVVEFLTISKNFRSDTISGSFYEASNPDCSSCNSRTVLMKGPYGYFWSCEECTWTESVEMSTSKGAVPKKTAMNCAKCGATMRTRSGSNGFFYGCSNYPRCTHTVSVRPMGNQVNTV